MKSQILPSLESPGCVNLVGCNILGSAQLVVHGEGSLSEMSVGYSSSFRLYLPELGLDLLAGSVNYSCKILVEFICSYEGDLQFSEFWIVGFLKRLEASSVVGRD